MPFSFDHDLQRRFLRVEISGFWTSDILASFEAEAASMFDRMLSAGASPGEGRILVIACNYSVQDKALTGSLSAMLPLYGRFAKRIAVVVSRSALQRLQTKRLAGTNAVIFDDVGDAECWLST